MRLHGPYKTSTFRAQGMGVKMELAGAWCVDRAAESNGIGWRPRSGSAEKSGAYQPCHGLPSRDGQGP